MYEDGIIVPKLFYKPKIFPLAEPEDGAKKCAELLVEDLTSDRTADLSLVSQQISSQPDSKILCEEVEESRPTTREKVVVVLASPCPTPVQPLEANYQPSVPVSQVWERDYRSSQFERVVYPHSFSHR